MSRRAGDRHTLGLLASLYASQAIPLGFFITAMPAILRAEGLSLERVGLFSAIAFPWLVKFLWAPAIDRWSPGAAADGRRHYLSWIVPLQTGAVAAVVALAMLDLGAQMLPVVAVAAVFMLLAATQDVASDGLAVTVLDVGERGVGNAMQVGGYFLGQVLGGGALLVVYGRFGWTPAVLAMAACLAVPLLVAIGYREPPRGASTAPGARRVGLADLGRFFTRAGASRWVAIVLLFRAGEAMATFVFVQMMVDQGVSLTVVGVVSGVVYSAGAVVGAAGAAWLVERLGRRPSLVAFALVQSATLLGYGLAVGGDVAALGVAAFAVACAGGLGTTALYASMMDASARRTAATDFTLQQSLAAIGPLLGTALSGFSAARFGFGGHFLLCSALGLVVVALLLRGSPPVIDSEPEGEDESARAPLDGMLDGSLEPEGA